MKEYVGVLLQLLVLVATADYGVAACATAGSEAYKLLCAAHFIPFGLDVASTAPLNDSSDSSPVQLIASSTPETASFGSYNSYPVPESLYEAANRPVVLIGDYKFQRLREAEELSTFAWEVEIGLCVVVILLALWLGFCLGAGKRTLSLQRCSGLQVCTQASTAVGSPESVQEEVATESFKNTLDGYSQGSCPQPDLPNLDLDSADLPTPALPLHLENGRLHSTFSKITEIHKDCRYRYYTATHILEGQCYILKEMIVPLTSLGNSQVLADFQVRSKCGSKYVLRYVTCWAEEASPSRVRVLVQIEYFSRNSLSSLLSSDISLGKKDVCRIYRQIVKGVHHLHEEGLTCYSLSPDSIYLDDSLNVKIADFELSSTRKTCRSLTVDGLEGFTDSLLLRRRQIRNLGLLLFQLMTKDEDALSDLMENHALGECFQQDYPLEAKMILGLVRKSAFWSEAADLLKSALFREWSEAAGVHSPTLPPKAMPGSLPLLSLIKVP